MSAANRPIDPFAMWNGSPVSQVYLMTSWTLTDDDANCATAAIDKIRESMIIPGQKRLISFRDGAK